MDSRLSPQENARILGELREILSSPKYACGDDVSLYDLFNVIRDKRKEYIKVVNDCHWVTGFDEIEFSYPRRELKLENNRYDYDDITFAKYNGDLYVKKNHYYSTNILLAQHGKEISKIFDRFLMLRDHADIYSLDKCIKSTNSSLTINLSKNGNRLNGVEIFYPYCDDYRCETKSNSLQMLDLIKGHEEEILKGVFVNVNECPLSIREEVLKTQNERRFNELYQKKLTKSKKSFWDIFK